jgi:hypothetical protein
MQYADGTWAVEGPVTITSITPISEELTDVLVASATAQAGSTPSTIRLAADSGSSDIYTPADISITGGTGAGQTRRFVDFNYFGAASPFDAQVYPDWTTTPDATSVYRIERTGLVNGAQIDIDPWQIIDVEHGLCNGDTLPRRGVEADGYGSTTAHKYNATLNLDPAINGSFVLAAGRTLVKVVNNWPISFLWGRPGFYRAAILTCVSTLPAAGTFRPHPYNPDVLARDFSGTSVYTTDDINRGLLPTLATVAGQGVPNDAYEDYWNRGPKFEMCYSIHNREMRFGDNTSGSDDHQFHWYGRDQSFKTSEALAYLASNFTAAQKEDLLIQMVQFGLDMYASARFQLAKSKVQADSLWNPNGGIPYGQCLPIVVVGELLGNASMKNALVGAELDSVQLPERDALFMVDSDFVTNFGAETGHTSSEIGMPEWGIRHRAYIEGWSPPPPESLRGWNYYLSSTDPGTPVAEEEYWNGVDIGIPQTNGYRTSSSMRSHPGAHLAALAMGLSAYLPEAFHKYIDRYLQAELLNPATLQYFASPEWVQTWWDTHRDSVSPARVDYSGYYPLTYGA